MSNKEPLKAAVYCRVAKDEQAESSAQEKHQKQFAAELLQQFLREQEVQPCHRYRLSSQ